MRCYLYTEKELSENRIVKWVRYTTSEEDLAILAMLHLDGLVVGLVALHLEAVGGLITHKPLLSLQDQHWPGEKRRKGWV